MNTYDEELQRNIEAGKESVADETDIKAYQEVFQRLKKGPEIQLSADFADIVLAKVIEKKERHSARDFFWFGIGIVVLAIAGVVSIVFSGFNFQLLKGTAGYAGLILFGLAFIVLVLNRFDKKLVSEKLLENNRLL